MSFANKLKDALWNFRSSKRAQIGTVVVLLVLMSAGAGYAVFGNQRGTPKAARENVNTAPAQVRRALDGVLVPADRANPFPVAVVIENLVAARPQEGLDDAQVVYEALAEGGITRFLALYASGVDVPKIGPVRSARSYFLDWVKEYDALFLYAGGSPDALQKIEAYDLRNLNQFFNGQYFWRDKERAKRSASEHTLFTSSELFVRALRDRKEPAQGAYETWDFADNPPLATRRTTQQISIAFSTFSYQVDYAYDRQTNRYLRSQGEQPHLMENGKQVAAHNVVVQFVPASLMPGDKAGRLQMETIGEGKALIFHNGAVVDGTWRKTDRDGRTKFYDADGREVTLTAGITWVEIVPPDRSVTYS